MPNILHQWPLAVTFVPDLFWIQSAGEGTGTAIAACEKTQSVAGRVGPIVTRDHEGAEFAAAGADYWIGKTKSLPSDRQAFPMQSEILQENLVAAGSDQLLAVGVLPIRGGAIAVGRSSDLD